MFGMFQIYIKFRNNKFWQKLCDISFADKVFFCNSGAEAVEGNKTEKYHLKKVIKIGQRSLLSKMHSMAGL